MREGKLLRLLRLLRQARESGLAVLEDAALAFLEENAIAFQVLSKLCLWGPVRRVCSGLLVPLTHMHFSHATHERQKEALDTLDVLEGPSRLASSSGPQ